MKFLAKFFDPPAEPISLAPALTGACPFCATPIVPGVNKLKCTNCGSTPRVRSMTVLLPYTLARDRADPGNASRDLLAFSASKAERDLLAPYFGKFVSVSLYGRYSSDHTAGVDARDLSRYPDASFGGHYSCLLFDYFSEHKQALAEAYRVIAPRGLFLTHILHTRVREDNGPPKTKSVIRSKAGYYEYIPEDEHMLSVRVGAGWFMRAMTKAGFRATRIRIGDPAGVVCDWFLGDKVGKAGILPRPGSGNSRSSADSSQDPV